MANKIYSEKAITISGIPEDYFSANGLEVLLIEDTLKHCGFESEIPEIKKAGLKIVPMGVQNASSGIIQDPAGSAIGQLTLVGGGGSGAIYSKFKDLMPIPKIPSGASVFNTSTHEGSRVLHTFSPFFGFPEPDLSPGKIKDRNRVLDELTNAYINAFNASKDASADESGPNYNADTLNLVPLSGKIFAGKFKDETIDHLHPSYTITAILLAMGYFIKNNLRILNYSLYYFIGDGAGIAVKPFNIATSIMDELGK